MKRATIRRLKNEAFAISWQRMVLLASMIEISPRDPTLIRYNIASHAQLRAIKAMLPSSSEKAR